MSQRTSYSVLWKYFVKTGTSFRAICSICQSHLSYKTTTANLKTHLRRKHPEHYSTLLSSKGPDRLTSTSDDDASNSSIKFATEILNYFEQSDEVSRCTICSQTSEPSVEEMKNHLEEEHPGILISILNNKVVNTDADEETYTEIVYLEDEQKQAIANKKRKTSHQKTEAKPTIDSRPDIDSFLNYLSVLLRNVPKSAMPKLQLDVISCVLNAQMIPIQNTQSKACNCKETISKEHGRTSIDLGETVDNSNIARTIEN